MYVVGGVRRPQPKDVKGYKPSKEEKQALADVYGKYNTSEREQNKYAFERQWFINLSFYLGYHHLIWDTTLETLIEPKQPSYRRNYVANMLFPMALRAVSKIAQDNPRLVVAPNSSELRDQQAAIIAEDVIDHIFEREGGEEKMREIALWAVICGSGFAKVSWDPSRGPSMSENLRALGFEIPLPATEGEAKKNATGGELTTDGEITPKIGDVRLDVVSPFRIFVDTGATNEEELAWMQDVRTLSTSLIKEYFPERGELVVGERDASIHGWFEKRLTALVGHSGYTAAPTADADDAAAVIEHFERPCKEYPRGRHIIVSNGVVLKLSDNPYVKLGFNFPFVKFDYAKMPGRYWGVSLIEQLLPPQRQYNRGRSQVLEAIDLISRPKWASPKGAGIAAGAFTSEPAEVLEYNANFPPPTPITPPPLPNYVLESIDRTIAEMQQIAAQSDVTQAKAPASVRSGVAIRLLQDQDESVMATPRRAYRILAKKIGHLILRVVAGGYIEPRIIKISGEDRSFEVKQFTGSDLRENFDVRLYAESGELDTKAARIQAVQDYVTSGILDPTNPDDKRVILRMLELGDVQRYVTEMTQDERNAEEENLLAAQVPAIEAQVRDYDNHAVHKRAHDAFRKGSTYRSMTPEGRSLLDLHVQVHDTYLAEEQRQMMMQMELARGGPGEKGRPSAPKKPTPNTGGSEAS